jgi:PAS domain S-box-containing protein
MFLFWGPELICFYNDAYRPSLGQDGKHPSILGMPGEQAWPEIWQIIKPLIDQVLTQGEATWHEDQLIPIYRNGKIEDVYWTFSYSPVYDESGKVAGVMVTCTETTDKINNLKKLAESEERFRNMAEGAEILIAVSDETAKSVYFNNAWTELSGVPNEDLLGFGWTDLIHPDDKKGFVDLYLDCFAKKISLSREFRLRDKQGIYRSFLAKGHPRLRSDGSSAGFIGSCVDITDIKRADEALEKSEQRFRNLIMKSPIAMAILRGPDHVIEMANEAMQIRWKKRGKEYLNKKISEAFPEILNQRFLKLLDEVYNTGKIHREHEAVTRVQEIDGEKIYYLDFEYAPLLDVDGQISGVLATANDVTESVESRRRVEESEKRFRSLAESLPQLTWETDEKGNALFASARWYEYTGIKPAGEAEWMAVVHPDDIENNTKAWLHSLATGETYKCDVRLRDKSGEYRWHSVIGEPVFDVQDRIMRWVGAFTDIHAEKEFAQIMEMQVRERTQELHQLNESLIKSDARYHQMVEEVEDYAILYLNNKGVIENWNKGAEKIKGYKAEEIIGKNFSTFYTEHDRKNNLPQHLLKRAADTGRAVQEGWRVRKDGTNFWASVVITAVHNEKNEVVGYSKVTHDLTDKKRSEDQLKANSAQLELKNEELEKMNKELQSFAYISSHDLQEPLRKIQTFSTQIVEKEFKNLSPEGRDRFLRMQKAAKRMQILIEDLLAYSRTSTAERKFERTDLKKIIDDVTEDLKEEIERTNAIVEVSDMCEANVIPFQFRQLVQNLLSNSLKFSKRNVAPMITIDDEIAKGETFDNEKLDPKTVYCHIRFSDNGIGFEPQYKDKIFEVFQRLHGKDQYDGTGVGLAIVKKIVENHNGVISVVSQPNKGASFDIYIPTEEEETS